MQEDTAKIIYNAMAWAAKAGPNPDGKVPKWTEGGNSNAQVEARAAASRIASLNQASRKQATP